MHTPLCEASGPMLAQQYCSCMAVVYNDACSQTCQRPLAVTGETLLRLIRRRRVFSCGAKTAACTTSHKHIAAEIAVLHEAWLDRRIHLCKIRKCACQLFIQICGRQHDFQRPTADRPQNQVRAIIMNAHPVVRGKRADACAPILFLHGGGV